MDNWILSLTQTCIALVFVAAAGSKLLGWTDWRVGARQLARALTATSGSNPERTVNRLATSIAFGLPAAEIGVAIALAVPATARAASLAAVVVTALLAVGSIRVVRSGQSVTCRCFGSNDETFGPLQVARNIALATIAVAGAAASRSVGEPTVVWSTIAGGVLLALTIVFWADVAFLAGIDPSQSRDSDTNRDQSVRPVAVHPVPVHPVTSKSTTSTSIPTQPLTMKAEQR